ncbi:MAG: hypothetical protein ACRCV9_11980 [Burkholderiaceae bacterium]
MFTVSARFALVLLPLCAVATLSSGCATATKSEYQSLDVFVKLPEGAPKAGVVCVLSNRASKVTGNAPMLSVSVERSGSDLEVLCRTQNGLTGRAVAVSKIQTHGLGAVLAGMTGHVIDHMTGKLYDYPRRIEVAIGRNRVFEQGAGIAAVSDVPLPGSNLAQTTDKAIAE